MPASQPCFSLQSMDYRHGLLTLSSFHPQFLSTFSSVGSASSHNFQSYYMNRVHLYHISLRSLGAILANPAALSLIPLKDQRRRFAGFGIELRDGLRRLIVPFERHVEVGKHLFMVEPVDVDGATG